MQAWATKIQTWEKMIGENPPVRRGRMVLREQFLAAARRKKELGLQVKNETVRIRV